jgi:hypothetical protein
LAKLKEFDVAVPLVLVLRLERVPATAFPPPWSVEELDACFVVRDHNGQKLALVYLKNELKDALTFLGEAQSCALLPYRC